LRIPPKALVYLPGQNSQWLQFITEYFAGCWLLYFPLSSDGEQRFSSHGLAGEWEVAVILQSKILFAIYFS